MGAISFETPLCVLDIITRILVQLQSMQDCVRLNVVNCLPPDEVTKIYLTLVEDTGSYQALD